MSDSTLECLVQDGVTVIVLNENYDNLDDANLKTDSDFLLEAANTVDPPLLVLDMSNTKFFASEFLGRLFRVWQRLQKRNGKLAVCAASELCGEILSVTRVDTIWTITKTRDEAIAQVKA
jgi:anti-anti-sigma factor